MGETIARKNQAGPFANRRLVSGERKLQVLGIRSMVTMLIAKRETRKPIPRKTWSQEEKSVLPKNSATEICPKAVAV
jgi:hypothetical protein